MERLGSLFAIRDSTCTICILAFMKACHLVLQWFILMRYWGHFNEFENHGPKAVLSDANFQEILIYHQQSEGYTASNFFTW
jgi:hypothetical protein